ncbi:mandelate racemase/muconate lactonizing enzyme family protein [Alkalihalobacillus oceani]|uniref:Mandelate racemase/muconate lactonizing enzyme family protein n=1 Tax=Halalkalibacter oceani TaxID=1653776 RepID=A0A9X2DPP4_9BACI|nr:mandelate racemase/muconate lactonizing enzyme family protein [Halalkalibacter oceani]MCM3714183.1 mandelate racemase/muconate lactonizing enzyme family protein [Halalkalibacter oceani]
MKVTNLTVHVLQVPLETPFAFSQGWVRQRSTVLVEIETDEGITGWGESLCHGLQPPEVAAAIIEHSLAPLVIGQDPFDVEVIWDKLFTFTRPYHGGAVINAMSAVDIALWDIVGKAVNKPVHKLLGGAYRTEIMPYATGFYREETKQYPEAAIEEAQRHIEKGFRAMKLKTGFGMKVDVDYITAVRQAVGAEILLMADANCAYNAATARRILFELAEADADLYWFEEPLDPEDIGGYKELKGLTSTFIASGENQFGPIGFRDWVANRALDVLQPDLCSSGGFTACKRIAVLASTWNTMLNPHVWGSGVGLAASLQYLATIPPARLALKPVEPMLEYDQSSHPFRSELIFDQISMNEQGMVKIPSQPGIGVEINRQVINKYKQN